MKIKLLENGIGKDNRKYNLSEMTFKDEYLGCLGVNEATESIPLNFVSHKINNLKVEDGSIIGDVTILNTPYGNIVKELIKNGADLVFSMSGSGNVDSSNNVTNYTLFSINIIKT